MEADGRLQKKSTSPWVYVGCGCGLAVFLGLLGLAGLTWGLFQQGKEMAETMSDPQKRAEKVRSVLPYDRLPEGYYPGFAFSAPLGMMEMAVFTDHDPDRPNGIGETSDMTSDMTSDNAPENSPENSPESNGTEKNEVDIDFDERGFMFMNMIGMRGNKAQMERYLRGEAPRPEDSGWSQSNVNFDAKENVRRGTLTVNGKQVLYSANRGEVNRKDGPDEDGLVTMVMPECGDNRLRFGMWFGPDPAPGTPVAEADFTGTNADPAAIQAFLSHFRMCGK